MATFNTISKVLATIIYKFMDEMDEDVYMEIRKKASAEDMRIEDYISDKAVKADVSDIDSLARLF